MRGLHWPKMFSGNVTTAWKSDEYREDTTQNLITLLKTNRNELFGDPYFGLTLKDYFYNPNNYVLKDMIIDVLYSQIAIFIPQLKIERRNIDIIQTHNGKLYVNFWGVNQIDYKIDNFNLELFDINKSLS